MLSSIVSKFTILTVGTLYPAYRSYKVVRNKDVRGYVKWMMYWIVFAIFSFVETLCDLFLSFWMPFYYEIKMIFILWLLSPWTKGASILYRNWIHPALSKHERKIDSMLEQAKSESYNQVLRWGSRGLLCAREVIATAALRGQAQIIEHIHRSHSTDDINKVQYQRNMKPLVEVEEQDESDELADHRCDSPSNMQESDEEIYVPRRSTRQRRRHSPVDTPSETTYNTIPRRTTRQHR